MASRARVHAYPGARADGADAGARGAQAAVSMSSGMGIVAAARRGTARVDLFHLEHTRRVEPLEGSEGGRAGDVRMAFLMSKRVGAGDVQALQFLDPGAEVLAVVVDDELKVFQLGFRAWFGAIAGHVASPLAQSPVLWQLRTRVELGKLVDKPQLVALATGREAVSGEGKFWIATAFSSGEIARFEYDHSLSARELASHKPQIQLASINIPLASCTFCPQGRHVLVLTLEEGRAAYVNLGEEQREEDSEPQAQHVGLGLHWLAAQWIKPGETALLVRRDGMRKLVSVPSGAERVSYQALCANAKAQWLLPLRLETADAGFWIMGGFTPPGVQGSRDEPQETKLYGFRRFDRPASAVVDILRRGMHSIAGGSILGATSCRFEEDKVPSWAIESGASAEAEFAVLVLTEVGISFVFVDRDECVPEENFTASLSTKENVHSQQEQRHPKPISGQARKEKDGRKSDKALPHRQSKAPSAAKRDIGKSRVEKTAPLGSRLAGTVRSLETRVKQAELDLCRLRTEFVTFTQEMSSSLDELASLVGAQTSQTT